MLSLSPKNHTRVRISSNSAFLVAAVAIGSQIPSTIAEIHDPVVRTLVQYLGILLVLYAALRVDLRSGDKSSLPPRDPPEPEKRA